MAAAQAQAQAQQLPLQPPRPIWGSVALALLGLGASVVVFATVRDREPSVHAGYAFAGLMIWLLGVARLLFGGLMIMTRIGHEQQRPQLPGELVAANNQNVANLKKRFLISFGLQDEEPVLAAAAAAAAA